MTVVALRVQISPELKEKVRMYAENNNENFSSATEKLLLLAFQQLENSDVCHGDIDSQHTRELADNATDDAAEVHAAEDETQPFTAKEIKALRKILKRKK